MNATILSLWDLFDCRDSGAAKLWNLSLIDLAMGYGAPPKCHTGLLGCAAAR